MVSWNLEDGYFIGPLVSHYGKWKEHSVTVP